MQLCFALLYLLVSVVITLVCTSDKLLNIKAACNKWQ
jgi:hypothetical protein